MMTIRTAPVRVGNSRKLQPGLKAKTISGLELAGGWTVRVAFISAMAKPTARPALHQSGPRPCRQAKPAAVPTRCPITVFRGWLKGESGYANVSRLLAANVPKSRT
jgi:hypothetical protein